MVLLWRMSSTVKDASSGITAQGVVPPALMCAVPSGQNYTVCTSLPKPTPSGSVWIGPSLFGTAEISGSGSGYGYDE